MRRKQRVVNPGKLVPVRRVRGSNFPKRLSRPTDPVMDLPNPIPRRSQSPIKPARLNPDKPPREDVYKRSGRNVRGFTL